MIKNVPDAIKNGIAYATEDRKQYGLNLTMIFDTTYTAACSLAPRPSSMDTRSWRSPPNTRSEFIRSHSISKGRILSGGKSAKVVFGRSGSARTRTFSSSTNPRVVSMPARSLRSTLINKMVEEGKPSSSSPPELRGNSHALDHLAPWRTVTSMARLADDTQENLMESP